MNNVVVISPVRTAIGNFGGSLREIPAARLGAIVIKETMNRAGFKPRTGEELLRYAPDCGRRLGLTELEKEYGNWNESLQTIQVDEVIMGNALQGGQGQNIARQAAIYGGMCKETNAFTVNKVCASGLKAIALGAQAIQTGEAEVIIAGGMESMSSTPYALPKARWGYRMSMQGFGELTDLMVYDGLWEIFYGYHMGITAENMAKEYDISREEQDQIGFLSHKRAKAAIAEGIFKEEIVPVLVPQKKETPIVFDTDERPMETSLDKMASLPPVFKKDGTVTAGNASGINDGASAMILTSKEKAEEFGVDTWGTIKSYASGAVDPAYMGVGPVPAVRKALKKAGLQIDDIDLIELNEAFASQTIACMRELDLGLENTNVHGSGIALGHPIGCTGARIIVTLLHEMKRKNLRYGLATMCIGGGQGMAMIMERE